jgi:hypothetical protein
MNTHRFDRLSQSLAETSRHSRRGILAALGITVLGALAGVDPDAARATRPSRRHTKRTKHHASTPRRKDARGQLHAALRRKPEPDGRCAFSTAGDACQEAACSDETTLQPACRCDEQGQCTCPDPVTCPNTLVCLREKAVCLSECRGDFDCANGRVCQQDGKCEVRFGCDCGNLNGCSGHGVCSEACTCVCDDPWTGITCSDGPVLSCDSYATCGECNAHLAEGCPWCLDGLADGRSGVCVPADECFVQGACRA